MDNTSALLKLENITIHKGGHRILEAVNLTLHQGDYTCIYGRSGTGKTSLLRVIALLDQPTGGKIIIQDRDYTHTSPETKAMARNQLIGYIPQHDNLIPQLTIRENILLPLTINHTPPDKIKHKLQEITRELEIQDLLDRYPHQLSGGQRRRAIIARALIKNPKLILADEPLSGLDDQLTQKTLQILKQHADNGAAIIHATPDTTIKPPCTQTYKIQTGKLVPQ